MTRWVRRGALLATLLVAAWLRLTGLDWDGLHHYHPDERYIAWVATTVEWPARWSQDAFNPRLSTFNPFYWPAARTTTGIVVPQAERRDFAYGHLPLYAGVAATRLVERVAPVVAGWVSAESFIARHLLNGADRYEFFHLTVVARTLTALIDVGSVALTYRLGRRLYNRRVGLLAALLLALTVTHIQLAHFFTADPYTTFFTLAAVLGFAGAVDGRLPAAGRLARLLAGAAAVGLAVGSKFSAVLLALPLAVAVWWWGALRALPVWRRAAVLLAAGALAAALFAVTNPFAVLDWGCDGVTTTVTLGPVALPPVEWHNCYLRNVTAQSDMVRGASRFPFTRQYLGTTPYLYFAEMLGRWGMGWPLGAAALAGTGWALLRAGGGLRRGGRRFSVALRPAQRSLWVTLAWVVPFVLITGGFQVKFMRYLQPAVPFVLIFGAAWLLSWRRRAARRAAVAVVVAATALYAAAFSAIYRAPHPWVTASAWLHDNVPSGAVIAGESWDEQLPSSLTVDGKRLSRTAFTLTTLSWLSTSGARDDVAKLDVNLGTLADADFVVIASNRNYGVLPRLPALYPLSGQVHARLFDGSLGFEPVLVAGRAPYLGGVTLHADRFAWPGVTPPALVQQFLAQPGSVLWGRADESFTVYDQPLVIILQNVARLSAESMRQQFDLPE